ncbi:hypothetical protein GCM10027169_40260 [Gordonia jinhuaensis]|uniref:Uncharacterized protein n=1 Tax=Gordonia jinhuaensis TaxID=1517702 RepID=A0A916SZM2_9ACTN|nr:hypothetical protein [Gordonia jinhuaensis]GGB25265.1 hypothetical protein GCM10011489_11890 [Gordonia jinhuaensis]
MSFSTASETASPTAADALGDFLRSRRAAVAPAERGIVRANHRRVPGVRRDILGLLDAMPDVASAMWSVAGPPIKT